jgi:hypothetical protein
MSTQSKTPLLSREASSDDEDLFLEFISDPEKGKIMQILQQVVDVANAPDSDYQTKDNTGVKPKHGVKQIKTDNIQIDSHTQQINEQKTLRKLYKKNPNIVDEQILKKTIENFRDRLTLYYLDYITNYFKDQSIAEKSKQIFDQYIRDHCKLSCVGSMVSACSRRSRSSHRGNEIKCDLPSYANPTATRGLMGLKFLIGIPNNLRHITPDHFINLAKQLEKSTKQPYGLNLRDLYRVITNSSHSITSRSSR